MVKPFVGAWPLKGKTTSPSSPLSFFCISHPLFRSILLFIKKASFELLIKEKYANVKLINSLRTSYPAHQRSLSKVGCSSKVCRCFARFTRPLPRPPTPFPSAYLAPPR